MLPLYSSAIKSNLPNPCSQVRKYSTSQFEVMAKESSTLNPFFITGFTDAEGCFLVIIRKASDTRTGWRVTLSFQINLHSKDLAVLKLIQNYFGGVGTIYYNNRRNSVNWMVNSLE